MLPVPLSKLSWVVNFSVRNVCVYGATGPIVSLYRTHYEPLPMSQQPQAVHNPPAAAANVAPAAIKATSKAPAKDAAAATQPLPAGKSAEHSAE